jgi:hypothetical protein
MPVVADFTVIQGDAVRRIGDGATLWEKQFPTGGRYVPGGAILMLMVKGLTVATKPVDVKINNRSVGRIYPYRGADPNHWFTQIINIGSGILNHPYNELQIQAVDYVGGGDDNFDDFYLRDVVCFFNQEA